MKFSLRSKKNRPEPDNSYGAGTFDHGLSPGSTKESKSRLPETTLIFFGSGPVAAKSLELLAQNFSIEAVVTKPKPAHHRGSFPVLDLAENLKLTVHTVGNKDELSKLIAARPFGSRLGVLIDFGIIIGQDVIDYFPMGIVNSHFSLLPEWRGADPITFSILSGQDKTGVSLMLLVEAMDEGPLIAYREQPLDGHETTPELTEKLIYMSNELLRNHLPDYVKKQTTMPQSITGKTISYSRKLTKEDGVIVWAKTAPQLEREIRAYIEWPKSTTTISGKEVIVTKASVVNATGQPGKAVVQGKNLVVYAGEKALKLEKLKPAGKKEMAAEAFLAGYKNLLR